MGLVRIESKKLDALLYSLFHPCSLLHTVLDVSVYTGRFRSLGLGTWKYAGPRKIGYKPILYITGSSNTHYARSSKPLYIPERLFKMSLLPWPSDLALPFTHGPVNKPTPVPRALIARTVPAVVIIHAPQGQIVIPIRVGCSIIIDVCH